MSTFFLHSGAIVLRQLYLIRSSVARVVPLFVWVAIDIVLWGFITRYLNSVTDSGPNFVFTLLGAVLLWDFFSRVLHGVTMAFFEDVWSRNFLNLFATPMTIQEYLAGLVFTSVFTSAISLIAMITLAGLLFHLSFFVYGAMLFPFLLVLFLFGISLGIFGSALVLRFGPAAEWFIWPFPAIVSPFVGVFYPLSTLPPWMQAISYCLPPAYVFEQMRSIVLGGHGSLPILAWSALLALGYLLATSWLFIRVYRHAQKTGLIARYSAESLS